MRPACRRRGAGALSRCLPAEPGPLGRGFDKTQSLRPVYLAVQPKNRHGAWSQFGKVCAQPHRSGNSWRTGRLRPTQRPAVAIWRVSDVPSFIGRSSATMPDRTRYMDLTRSSRRNRTAPCSSARNGAPSNICCHSDMIEIIRAFGHIR